MGDCNLQCHNQQLAYLSISNLGPFWDQTSCKKHSNPPRRLCVIEINIFAINFTKDKGMRMEHG